MCTSWSVSEETVPFQHTVVVTHDSLSTREKHQKKKKIAVQVWLLTFALGKHTKKQTVCIHLIPFNELWLAFLAHTHVLYYHRDMAQG